MSTHFIKKKYYYCRMTDIHERLKQARLGAGFHNVKSFTDAIGVAYQTYINHENGYRGIRNETLLLYASRLGVSPEWLLTGKGQASERPMNKGEFISTVPVIGRVAAGVWMEVEEYQQDLGTAQAISSHPAAHQFAVIAEGTSMNKVIQSGETLICLDVCTSGYSPKEGDLVVVTRKRFGGSMIETTIKRLKRGKTGALELWAESTDPRYAYDGAMPYGTHESEETTIIGKVLGAWKSL